MCALCKRRTCNTSLIFAFAAALSLRLWIVARPRCIVAYGVPNRARTTSIRHAGSRRSVQSCTPSHPCRRIADECRIRHGAVFMTDTRTRGAKRCKKRAKPFKRRRMRIPISTTPGLVCLFFRVNMTPECLVSSSHVRHGPATLRVPGENRGLRLRVCLLGGLHHTLLHTHYSSKLLGR